MRLIKVGREASVYRCDDGVVWIANRPDSHDTCVVGWTLCWSRLSPPHFPEVYDITWSDEYVHVEMEYVEGARPGEWDGQQADAILGALRTANIFHRDIRLDNLVRRITGEWCLVDFGWACDYGNVYPGKPKLGGACRSPNGPDDAYAMNKIRQMLKDSR